MMTRTATEILLGWASRATLEEQRDFSEWFEKELEYYSKPQHGGITGKVMELLLDKFEYTDRLTRETVK